jgi:hypothetical protein
MKFVLTMLLALVPSIAAAQSASRCAENCTISKPMVTASLPQTQPCTGSGCAHPQLGATNATLIPGRSDKVRELSKPKELQLACVARGYICYRPGWDRTLECCGLDSCLCINQGCAYQVCHP